MKGVNLIPAHRLTSRRRRSRLVGWSAACAAHAVALGAVYGWLVLTATQEHRNWPAEIERVESEIKDSSRDLAQQTSALAREQAVLRAHEAVGDQPDWSMLLGMVSRHVGTEIVIDKTSLGPLAPLLPGAPAPAGAASGFRLLLTGLGETHRRVSAFVLSLEGTGVFSKVTLIDTKRTPGPVGDSVWFQIECVFADDSGGTR